MLILPLKPLLQRTYVGPARRFMKRRQTKEGPAEAPARSRRVSLGKAISAKAAKRLCFKKQHPVAVISLRSLVLQKTCICCRGCNIPQNGVGSHLGLNWNFQNRGPTVDPK